MILSQSAKYEMKSYQFEIKQSIAFPSESPMTAFQLLSEPQLYQLNINIEMTWTRLFYIKSVEQAFKRVIPGRQRTELPISKRYQAQIKKEFRIAGVPWIYNLKEPKLNPRDKLPKPQKKTLEKQIRIQKIQKALKENEAKEIQYRQQRLNNRRLRGSDQMLARGLPGWIKADLQQTPGYMLKRRGDDDEDDQ